MRRLTSPVLWLPVGLLLIAAIGANLLRADAYVQLAERDRTAYGARPEWLAAFDALSATCSVGLTRFDLREQYTPSGRWVLLALGGAGTLLYAAALVVTLRRLAGPSRERRGRGRRTAAIAAVCVAAGIGLSLVPWTTLDESRGWQAAAAVLGMGLARELGGFTIWVAVGCGLVALASALPWCAASPRSGEHTGRRWRLAFPVVTLVSYAAMVWGAATLVAALESPRGESGWQGHGTQHKSADQARPLTLGDRVLQVLAAGHAGLPTQPLGERGASEGAKLVLAIVVAIGSLGGVTGGVGWVLVLIALGGARGVAPDVPEPARRHLRRRMSRGARLALAAMFALTLIVALGLLVIEARVTSRFEAPATLGDVVLDAASLVGGAGLTSGVIENLTSAHLSRGMGQAVDSYLYATVWCMLAMVAGRILPIVALCALAGNSNHQGAKTPSSI